MRMFLGVATVLALLLTAVSGVVTAPAANADCLECGPWHAGPRKAYPKDNPLTAHELSLLTPRQRHAVIASVHHRVSFRSSPSPLAAQQLRAAGLDPAASVQCGDYMFEIYTENALGWHIWYFKDTVHWCWDGRHVVAITPPHTQVKIYDWASADGWEYSGIEDSAQYDYFHDRWVYSTYRQGKFSFCPPRIFCLSTKYPWMYQYTYGSGSVGNGGWGA